MGNRQSTFHQFKFSVCLHTPKIFKIWNLVCLFSTKFSKLQLKIFLCQNRKSELSIDGVIISVPLLTFGVRKWQKLFCKMSQKVHPERLFEFHLCILCAAFCEDNNHKKNQKKNIILCTNFGIFLIFPTVNSLHLPKDWRRHSQNKTGAGVLDLLGPPIYSKLPPPSGLSATVLKSDRLQGSVTNAKKSVRGGGEFTAA